MTNLNNIKRYKFNIRYVLIDGEYVIDLSESNGLLKDDFIMRDLTIPQLAAIIETSYYEICGPAIIKVNDEGICEIEFWGEEK